jgi:hypothetical protein
VHSNDSPLSGADIKNAWSYTSIRDSFTCFTFTQDVEGP